MVPVSRRSQRRRRRSTTACFIVIFVITLVRLGVFVLDNDPSSALFRTFTRAFQSGIHGPACLCGFMIVIVMRPFVAMVVVLLIISMIPFILVFALGELDKGGILTLIFQEEVVAGQLLFLVHLGLVLVDAGTEGVRVSTEGDVQVLEEFVAPGK